MEQPETSRSLASAGRLLRQARDDLKLAPEDVAGILRLSLKQIIALEKDDYASLPGPTYVRGYLRSYAQLLNLAPERVIDCYNKALAASAPVEAVKAAVPEQVTSKDARVQAVTIGIVVLVVGLGVLWWVGQRKEPARVPAPTSPSERADVSTGAPGYTLQEAPAPVVAVTPVVPQTPAPSQSVPPAAAVARAAAPAVSAPPTSPTTSTTVPAPAQPPLAAATAPVPAPATTPAVKPGPKVRVVLRTEQESWVDVRDAEQNKLLYQTLPAGQTVTLEGSAPLSVFLGNVEGVRVEYNGQPYDAARHRRGPIARFTLGQAGSGTN